MPLNYNGTEMELTLKMDAYSYTFRVEVLISDTAVIFEPDEEGCYRVLVDVGQMEKNKSLSRGLLQVVAEALEILR